MANDYAYLDILWNCSQPKQNKTTLILEDALFFCLGWFTLTDIYWWIGQVIQVSWVKQSLCLEGAPNLPQNATRYRQSTVLTLICIPGTGVRKN